MEENSNPEVKKGTRIDTQGIRMNANELLQIKTKVKKL